MRWIKMLRLRFRSLFRSSRVEDELGEELQYHLERLVETYVARGMSPQDARYAARREMGAIEQRKEDCRDARGLALVYSVRQDVTYALRGLRKSPGFTAVATLSLALGIGANTAIFSLWNGVLHSSLPSVHQPEQLVILSNPDDSGSWTGRLEGPRSWLTYEEFEQLGDHAEAFSALMASQSSLSTWLVRFEGSATEETSGRLVSGAFFQVLGVSPAIGRLFTTAEDRGESPYAVISHGYWQRRFGGRVDVLGTTFTVRNAVMTIIGVAPPGFIGETSGQQPDLWFPLRMQPTLLPGRDRLDDTPPDKSMWLHVFGRLKPGVTQAHAQAEANGIFQAGLETFYGALASGERRREFLNQSLRVQPGARGASSARNNFFQSLTALLAAVGVLLLIACANLANLLLARGAARKPEMALRLSFGASRGRIIRQLLTESLALAALGGVAAIAVASVFHDALVAMMTKSDPDFRMSFGLDPTVLAFVMAATVAAALLFGLLPACQMTKIHGARLNEHGRGTIGTPGQLRSGRFLVSLQLALSLPLLVGAGLLAQTAYNLQRADLGFPTDRLLLVRVDLREVARDSVHRDDLLRALLEQIRHVPGVRAASFSQLGLFSGGQSSSTIAVEGYTPKGNDDRESAMDFVGPGYFSTLGVPVTLGRDILESDRHDAPKVCVINEAFAKRFFDRRNPIGMSITLVNDDSQTAYHVVGVAKNARAQSLRGVIEPRFFVPLTQRSSSGTSPIFLIRTAAETSAVTAATRKAIERVHAALPIMSATSLEEEMAPLTAQDRTTAQLAFVFGSVALTLAAIGLYGVLSYGIARRTGEIAIRIALGAEPSGVTSMVLRETIGLVCVGLAMGGALAYAATRLIDSQLYGVAAQDPLTVALATALLLFVALSAAYVPAERASRLDPVAALRQS